MKKPTTKKPKFTLRYRERFLLLAVQDNPNVFQDYKEPKILKRLQELDLVRNSQDARETVIFFPQKYTASGAFIREQILKNADWNKVQA